MRYVAGSAAIILAAVMSFNSAGESETCQYCLEIAKENSTKENNENPTEAKPVGKESSTEISSIATGKSADNEQSDAPAGKVEQTATAITTETKEELVTRAEPPDLCTALVDAARNNDLPPNFLLRLIWQESRFNPRVVSHAGAQGIAQFMPGTAAEMGLSDPHDPLEALPASGRLLKRLHREFGNLGLAAAAYNAGSGRIRNWLSNKQSLPQETRNYIRIITGHSAETWTRENSLLAMPQELPRGIPCKDGPPVEASDSPITVALTEEMSHRVRSARAEMVVMSSRKRKSTRMVASLRKAKPGKTIALASHRKSKATIAKAPAKQKNVKVASAR